MQVVRILGVDPGSRLTGYGCVDVRGNQITHVAHGTLRLSNTSGRAEIPLEQRLLSLHHGLIDVIETYKPQIMVVERVFFAKNAVSALKLGQARGAVILSGAIRGLTIAEYNPTEVKAAVAGWGQADKEQVAKMVQMLIRCGDFATYDATDALALAICHAQRMSNNPAAALLQKRGKSRKRLSLAEAIGVLPEGRSR